MESGFKMCGVRLAVLALFCVSIVASLQPPSLNGPPREEGEEDSLFVVNRSVKRAEESAVSKKIFV